MRRLPASPSGPNEHQHHTDNGNAQQGRIQLVWEGLAGLLRLGEELSVVRQNRSDQRQHIDGAFAEHSATADKAGIGFLIEHLWRNTPGD